MTDTVYKHDDPLVLAKRAFWLAYEAAGGPAGMGWLQAIDDANEELVWNNVMSAGDYPGPPQFSTDREGVHRIHGDYIFGRMVKLYIGVGKDGIHYRDAPLSPDYEAWCVTYPTIKDLLDAAEASLAEEEIRRDDR